LLGFYDRIESDAVEWQEARIVPEARTDEAVSGRPVIVEPEKVLEKET
jgi:hypothetical protein